MIRILRREPLLLVWMGVVCASLLGFAAYLLAHQWFPQEYEAIIAVHTKDVFSSHPPPLGMQSTSNLTNPGVWAHHPGPMEFYLLAVPYALSGWSSWGLIAGCAAIAVALTATAIWSGFRAGGWPGALLAGGVAATIQAIFGPSLVQPLNTWPPVLGLLAMLMLGWRLMRRQIAALPGYALVASFVAQCHLAFLPIVLVCSLVLGAVGALRWRRLRGSWWPLLGDHRVRLRGALSSRPGWQAVAITAVCWLPPFISLFTLHPDNASELFRLTTAGTSGATVGWGGALAHFLTQLVPFQRWVATTGSADAVLPLDAFAPPPLGVVPLVLGCATIGCAAYILWSRRRVLLRDNTKRLRLPGILALAIVCCIPMLWTSSQLVGAYRLTYSNLLVAAPLLVTGAVVWWVCSQARRCRWLPRRVPAGAYIVLAIPVLAIVHSTAAVGLTDTKATAWTRARSIVDVVVPEVNRIAPGKPVAIESQGPVSQVSVGPSAAARLHADGYPVFYDSGWPRAQDDDFRRLAKAPGDATRVVFRERSADGRWFGPASAPSGATWTKEFPIEVAGYRGTMQVVVYRVG